MNSAKAVAHSLIQKIDSGEGNLFLEQLNANSDGLTYRFFDDGHNTGVFVSFPYYGALRVQISFSEDTGEYTDEIADLLFQSHRKSGLDKVFVWIRNENQMMIRGLQACIEFNKKGINNSHYASTEYIMPRGHSHRSVRRTLSIKEYDEHRIDEYLQMLDESMEFKDPPPAYTQNREHFRKKFAELRTVDSFETFWAQDDLVGLYWRTGAEIDVMAVAPEWQRRGFGSSILSRAIDVIMENTKAPYAYLYCVDWNIKAHTFYRKYGMIMRGHSYLLSIG